VRRDSPGSSHPPVCPTAIPRVDHNRLNAGHHSRHKGGNLAAERLYVVRIGDRSTAAGSHAQR